MSDLLIDFVDKPRGVLWRGAVEEYDSRSFLHNFIKDDDDLLPNPLGMSIFLNYITLLEYFMIFSFRF